MVSQWGVVLVLSLGLLHATDAFPSLVGVKSPSAPTPLTIAQIKEDEMERGIAYIDSPYDSADGQVALPTKVYGSLGAKKWVEDVAQRPLYKAPPFVTPTPKPRVEVAPVPNVNELKAAALSVNDTLFAFMSRLASAKEGRKPPGNMAAKALGNLAAAEEGDAKDHVIEKLQVEADRRLAVQATKAHNLLAEAFSAKTNLTKASAVLEEAMHTSNQSHVLIQWLKEAEANHETDRAAILRNDIGEAGLTQARALAKAVINEKFATKAMFAAAKLSLRSRPLNMTGADGVFALTNKKMKTKKTNGTQSQNETTQAPIEDDDAPDGPSANETNGTSSKKKPIWAEMPKIKKNGGFCKDGTDCNNHGSCVNGICKCFKGWTYVDCSMRACKHGRWSRSEPGAMCPTCEPTLMPLHCLCDEDYYGPSCMQKLCPGRTPGIKTEKTQCSNNGNCVEGECDCDDAYTGNGCQTHKCSRNGDYENGTCACYDGFWGLDCAHKMCPASERNTTAGTLVLCSGNGACSPAGFCTCKADGEQPGCCPTGCRNHGRCTPGGCRCSAGYEGNACHLGPCMNGCSGHGLCVGLKYSGKNKTGCKCDEGWTGLGCETPKCPAKGGKYCAGNGECDFATGVCLCDDDHKGDECTDTLCPNMCGNNGPTNATRGMCNYETGKCKCNEEFEGPACESVSCYKLNNCSAHGSCEDGNCSCAAGWGGDTCQIETSIACLNNCSNHGECVFGKCSCAYGYRGKACNELKCFHGARYKKACNSSRNATLVEDDMPTKIGMKVTCVCDNGWDGIHCNTTADTPSALVSDTLSANESAQAANEQLAAMPCPVVVAGPPPADSTHLALHMNLKKFNESNKVAFEEALKTDIALSLEVLKSRITVNAITVARDSVVSTTAVSFIELTAAGNLTAVDVDITIVGGDTVKVAAFPKGAKFVNLGLTCGEAITSDSITVSRVVEAAEDQEGPKKPNLSGLFALLGANSSAPGAAAVEKTAPGATTTECTDNDLAKYGKDGKGGCVKLRKKNKAQKIKICQDKGNNGAKEACPLTCGVCKKTITTEVEDGAGPVAAETITTEVEDGAGPVAAETEA